MKQEDAYKMATIFILKGVLLEVSDWTDIFFLCLVLTDLDKEVCTVKESLGISLILMLKRIYRKVLLWDVKEEDAVSGSHFYLKEVLLEASD